LLFNLLKIPHISLIALSQSHKILDQIGSIPCKFTKVLSFDPTDTPGKNVGASKA
jgi:hypothetical protein